MAKSVTAEKKGLIVSLGDLVDSRKPLSSFLASVPMPLFTKMDLQVAIKTEIDPQVETYFDLMKSLLKEQGAGEIEGPILVKHFPSPEHAQRFFVGIQELRSREVELKLVKRIKRSEIEKYIEDAGLDKSKIFLGNELEALDWLIDIFG